MAAEEPQKRQHGEWRRGASQLGSGGWLAGGGPTTSLAEGEALRAAYDIARA